MKHFFKRTLLILNLIWTHIVFWLYSSLDEDYHSILGKIYFDLSRYEKAIRHFNKSEKKHNNTSTNFSKYNWYYIGYSYYNLGDFKSAIHYLEKYLMLNPNDKETLLNMADAQALLFNNQEALKAFTKLLDQPDGGPYLHIRCSEIWSEAGDKAKAMDCVLLAEYLVKNKIDRQVIQAMKLNIEKDYSSSINIINALITESRAAEKLSEIFSSADLYYSLAELQRRSSNLAGSVDTLEKALKRHPADIWLMNSLAAALADLGENLPKALELINQALKTTPRNPLFLDTKGWVLFKLGSHEEAAQLVRQALGSMPNNQEAAKHLQAIEAHQSDSKHDLDKQA
jgi:tetratricopeptide (TPR) repeat protein